MRPLNTRGTQGSVRAHCAFSVLSLPVMPMPIATGFDLDCRITQLWVLCASLSDLESLVNELILFDHEHEETSDKLKEGSRMLTLPSCAHGDMQASLAPVTYFMLCDAHRSQSGPWRRRDVAMFVGQL